MQLYPLVFLQVETWFRPSAAFFDHETGLKYISAISFSKSSPIQSATLI